MTNLAVNAGVDAQVGFTLQRNTALYLLLENYYTKFKDKQYFVCLEHHDDFLFCFLNDQNEAEIIEAYQSKKKSPNTWTLNASLLEIIFKVLETGESLHIDAIKKSASYRHRLFFSTNQTISLVVKKEKKVEASVGIDETNSLIDFPSLAKCIQEKIKAGISTASLHSQLDNLHFLWIDLNRTPKKQENQLEGQLTEIFGNQIQNKRAAVETLLSLFKKIEKTYNQGNKARLLDETKRVTSTEIEESLNVITTKSKCFEFWRSQINEVCTTLQIRVTQRDEFQFAFSSAFDLFKSSKEAEHRRILDYVKSNIEHCVSFTDKDVVLELITKFLSGNNTRFKELEVKAVFFAAFFEATYKNEN